VNLDLCVDCRINPPPGRFPSLSEDFSLPKSEAPPPPPPPPLLTSKIGVGCCVLLLYIFRIPSFCLPQRPALMTGSPSFPSNLYKTFPSVGALHVHAPVQQETDIPTTLYARSPPLVFSPPFIPCPEPSIISRRSSDGHVVKVLSPPQH